MRRKIKAAAALLAAAAMTLSVSAVVFAEEETTILRVGMECDYAPYSWAQETDENGAVPILDSTVYAYGYDVMMAKHICEELGWDLQILKIDWDAMVPAVVSGTVDCAIAGQSVTSERMEYVDFSDPYYSAPIVALTLEGGDYEDAKGLSDLAGASCTSQMETVWYDTCLPQIPDADILEAQETVPKMLDALDGKKCDLVVTDLPAAAAACAAYPNFVLLDFSDSEDDFAVTGQETDICISVQKGNDALLEAINGVLAGMSGEEYEEMMNEAIALQPLSEEEE